jgi:hypothetical protein
MEMSREEWLRRYRAHYKSRKPDLPEEYLDDIVTIEAHEALSGEYPNDPERAVDD